MQELLKRQNYLKKEMVRCLEQMKELPNKDIFYTKSGKYIRWYISNGRKPIYLHKSDEELIRQLVLRKYLNERYQEYKRECATIENVIASDVKKSELMLQDESPYAPFLKGTFMGDYDRLWMKENYERNCNYLEHLIYKTLGGDKVRSKSEVMIADELFRRGIPYRYECALQLGEVTLFLDFTIRNPVSQEMIYWEHMGIMDNYKYAKKSVEKMEIYLSHHIIPGINIILTYETVDKPIDSQKISQVIDMYF